MGGGCSSVRCGRGVGKCLDGYLNWFLIGSRRFLDVCDWLKPVTVMESVHVGGMNLCVWGPRIPVLVCFRCSQVRWSVVLVFVLPWFQFGGFSVGWNLFRLVFVVFCPYLSYFLRFLVQNLSGSVWLGSPTVSQGVNLNFHPVIGLRLRYYYSPSSQCPVSRVSILWVFVSVVNRLFPCLGRVFLFLGSCFLCFFVCKTLVGWFRKESTRFRVFRSCPFPPTNPFCRWD